MEVAGIIEEILGDRGVGARLHLAHEVVDVALEARRFRMTLRVARYQNVESAAFLDEGDELGGEAKPALRNRDVGSRLLPEEGRLPERQDAGEAGLEVARGGARSPPA
jgi:hypothetical protein